LAFGGGLIITSLLYPISSTPTFAAWKKQQQQDLAVDPLLPPAVFMASDSADVAMPACNHDVHNHLHHPPPLLPCRRDAESLRFFTGLSTRDEQARRQAIDAVCKTFQNWLGGFGSPKELIVPNGQSDGACSDLKALIVEQLPDLLRLSEMCPFPDVRDRCCDILHDLEVSHTHPIHLAPAFVRPAKHS
jgi:hypothetical protein